MLLFSDESGRIGLSFLLLFVLLSLIVGGIYMLDRMEFVDGERLVYSAARRLPGVRDYFLPRPLSESEMQENRLRRRAERLDRIETELSRQSRSLADREQELEARIADAERLEERMADRERALLERQRRFDEREERLLYLADLYQGMPPVEAAARINDIEDDQIVIALLRRMEQQTVSFILTNLEPARVAVLTRKIANSPG